MTRDFVRFPPTVDPDAPPPLISGVVTIRVPTGQNVHRIYVVLEAKADLFGTSMGSLEVRIAKGWLTNRTWSAASGNSRWPAEKGTVFRKLVELLTGEQELAAGEHV